MNGNVDPSRIAGRARLASIGAQIILAAAATGCGNNVAPVTGNNASPERDKSLIAQSSRRGDHADPYRIRPDIQRGRYWVLGHDHVHIYSTTDKRLIQKIVLPGWNVAGFLGVPDMVLDRSGAAWISSNIVPMLWRIDPDSFNVTRIDITLQTKENWDVGFTGLAFAADGTLFGVTASTASLWTLKPDESKATPISLSPPAPILDARALWVSYQAVPGVSPVKPTLCIASAAGLLRIELSVDSSRGRISETSCDSN